MQWPIVLVQLFFTLGWTLYVIFLPGLLKRAGIDAAWLPWILIADQLLFAAADVATGVWLDRSEQFLRSAGNWMTALILAACAVFVSLPLLADSMPAWLFVPALFVWVICSSALRVPPLVLLARFTPPAQGAGGGINGVAAYLFGIGVAGALAPYLTVLLKNRDPLLPMVLASAALAVTTLVLRRELIARATSAGPVSPSSATSRFIIALPLLAAVGLFAFGMQVHTAVNSAKLFIRIAPQLPLEWLMPLYWAGFSVAMFPASWWLARKPHLPGAHSTIAANSLLLAGIGGGILLVACASRPPLPLLIALQICAGAAWSMVFLAAIAIAGEQGRTGREGGWIGATLALIALATMGRMLLVSALSPAGSSDFGAAIAAQLPWVTGVCWLVAAVVLGLSVSRRRAV